MDKTPYVKTTIIFKTEPEEKRCRFEEFPNAENTDESEKSGPFRLPQSHVLLVAFDAHGHCPPRRLITRVYSSSPPSQVVYVLKTVL